MSGTAESLLARMLGKKLFVVLWKAHEGAQLGPVLHEHLQFMIDLEKRGVLFASGPLSGTPGDGLSVLRAASMDEAQAIAERDPFVLKGLRTFDLREWTVMEGSIGLTINCSDRSVALA
ncbi:hypothetical protein DW352_10605 [Pseudolabrys taiwanensis]|uniref:YCII-related domain-containing protein n=1 Tax=Pseudolabrys taiwanensis TaxID=331696 RepID=A0A345ZVH2_9HYPH|nr:YciI family protein [Pseudolabrys taiwanensis]AXK80919.1 hypothetical protein DW352_10605 [Pseudolabrys taiwanensis]